MRIQEPGSTSWCSAVLSINALVRLHLFCKESELAALPAAPDVAQVLLHLVSLILHALRVQPRFCICHQLLYVLAHHLHTPLA